jgi:hypothetical protein
VPSSDDQAADSPRGSGSEPVAAYVVLSHRDPDQVERLVAAIRRSSPRAHVVVAHDGRQSPAPRALDEQVHVWEHGLRTDWGSWELVEATLGAFERARALADPSLVALVSGADYPTRDLAVWERDFVAAGGGWVGEAQPLHYRPRWGRRYGEGRDDLTRYTYRWIPLPDSGLTRRLPRRVEEVRRRVRDALFLAVEPALSRRFVARGRGAHLGVRRLRTPFSGSRPCYKGSQWVAMDRGLLDRLLETAGPGSALARFYKHTIIPDESLIPTVLSWAAPPSPAPLTYLAHIDGPEGPRLLVEADLADIVSSEAVFCRKVSSPASDSLLAALEGHKAG